MKVSISGVDDMAAPVMFARWAIRSEHAGTAGLWGGMELDGRKLRGQEAGGSGSSVIGGGWGEVAGSFKGSRCWGGVGAGYV